MICNLDDLKFEGGYPTAETTEKLNDQLDMHPRDYGVSETGGMVVHVESGEGKVEAIHLTCNTESICASLSLELKQTGPAIFEVPPNVLGVINDGFFLYLADLGNATRP
jgi:hypothetical protein